VQRTLPGSFSNVTTEPSKPIWRFVPTDRQQYRAQCMLPTDLLYLMQGDGSTHHPFQNRQLSHFTTTRQIRQQHRFRHWVTSLSSDRTVSSILQPAFCSVCFLADFIRAPVLLGISSEYWVVALDLFYTLNRINRRFATRNETGRSSHNGCQIK